MGSGTMLGSGIYKLHHTYYPSLGCPGFMLASVVNRWSKVDAEAGLILAQCFEMTLEATLNTLSDGAEVA